MNYRNLPQHFVRGIFEKLEGFLAHWHAKLKI